MSDLYDRLAEGLEAEVWGSPEQLYAEAATHVPQAFTLHDGDRYRDRPVVEVELKGGLL